MAQGVADNQLKECEKYASQVTRAALKLARRMDQWIERFSAR
jgi:hypothetical protein